jgi:4-hydroxythreonine-4-phosphate dehydrogenase
VITCGDPCGVGPELFVRALGRSRVHPSGRSTILPIWIVGSRELLERAALEVVAPTDPRTAHRFLERLGSRYLLVDCPAPARLTPGTWSEDNVGSCLSALERATELALLENAVLVTGPMDKRFFAAIGLPHAGHTEFLARFCRCPDEPLMWFDSVRVRVGLLTRHVPLGAVPSLVRRDLLERSASLALDFLARTHPTQGRPLAVAGLDPHCGEWGAISTIDLDVKGWIEAMRDRLIPIAGPFSADTLFAPSSLERYSGILCWYHDQGMIPVKLLAFSDAVNATLGLPLVRTSPAHGVAYDIAWKGQASPASTQRAISLALELSRPD